MGGGRVGEGSVDFIEMEEMSQCMTRGMTFSLQGSTAVTNRIEYCKKKE